MIGRATILVIAASVLLSPATWAQVRLEIVAPPQLTATARSLERVAPGRLATAQRLVGLEDPGAPIRVLVAPEGSAPARAVPTWVAGYALGDRGLVVVMPARSISYPDSSLDELLLHEVTHVLIARAARHRPVPRWFNEGVAMAAVGSWGVGDRSRLGLALLRRGDLELADLSRLFVGGRSQVPRAYAISGAAVREMLKLHGDDTARQVLGELARGEAFPDAFRAATGTTLREFEESFWSRYTFWYRWLPFLTSSATLWLAIVLLAVWAARRRRARRAELERRWDQEEEARRPPEPDRELVN